MSQIRRLLEPEKFAHEREWPLPKPKDPFDMLAKEFTQAARQEFRRDARTGKPYRANHALPVNQGGTQLTLWIDIDEAPRHQMQKSLINRREQMVGDGVQLSLDADHWNSIHENEEPIDIPMDLTDDIEWRKNAPDEDGGGRLASLVMRHGLLTDEARAKLLCYLAVAQLVAQARTGEWLRTDHLVESTRIWLTSNVAAVRWEDRMRLGDLSRKVALGLFNEPHLSDAGRLARLFTDGWRLDYTSPVVQEIHKRCADALRYK